MIWFSDIFHKFPRLSRISTLFLILLVVFPTVFSDGCAFSRHAPDQSAHISSGYEPDQADSVSSESTDNDNQRTDSSSANAFDEFLLQLFRSEAAQNTINLHFSLSSPESYGITEVPISLGSISSQASNENRAALENTTAALKRFDREKLSKTRQLTYDILSDYLAMEQKGTDFSLYEEYLNPSSGTQAQLPVLYEEYRFLDAAISFYPAKDLLFYQADIRSKELVSQRMQVIQAVLKGEPITVVASFDAFMDALLPKEMIKSRVIKICSDETLNLDELSVKLAQCGYDREIEVAGPGQFAVRGGILDVYPLTEELPVRIELWGDEVDSIRTFDPETQRSIEKLDEVEVFPATEFPEEEEKRVSFLDYFEKENTSDYLKASGSPSIVTNLFSQWYGPTNYNDSVNIDPFIYSEYKLEEANYIDTNNFTRNN